MKGGRQGESREQGKKPLCLFSFVDSKKCPSEKSKRKRWGKKVFKVKRKRIIFCVKIKHLFSASTVLVISTKILTEKKANKSKFVLGNFRSV